jgi:hypothetical protein
VTTFDSAAAGLEPALLEEREVVRLSCSIPFLVRTLVSDHCLNYEPAKRLDDSPASAGDAFRNFLSPGRLTAGDRS